MQGQQLQALLLDPHVPAVDLVIPPGELGRQTVVRLAQLVDGRMDHLLDHGAQGKDVAVKRLQVRGSGGST